MSRIDDPSEERLAEARAAERRAQERLQSQSKSEATAFDRALAAKAPKPPPRPPERGGASAGFRRALADAKPDSDLDAKLEEELPSEGEEASDETTDSAPAGDSERAQSPLALRARSAAGKASAAQASRGGALGQVSARRLDASARRVDSESRRAQTRDEDRQRSAVSGAPERQGEPVDSEAGGQGGSDKDKRGKGEERMAAFKLPNAALMAPPPVARPKNEPNAALRGAAREIVEKIVRRVLVGTNEQGVPEFRLELKSSVLQGLSIRVSASRGKRIRAVFSSANRTVLASLEKTSQELKDALAARGLVLEEVTFEEPKAP